MKAPMHAQARNEILMLRELFVVALLSNGGFVSSTDNYMWSEYSLMRPYGSLFSSMDGWVTSGSAVATDTGIFLTRDIKSQSGGIWLTKPIPFLNWKVVIEFRVEGSGNHFFGDGFAFWYLDSHSKTGPVFGSQDYFKGLGVLFDTYSNHNDAHKHAHPYISAQVNDGSFHYDHDSDGTHSEIDGCSHNFRGAGTVTVEIIYFGSNLTLMVQFLKGSYKNSYELCVFSTAVTLPTEYYIGLSAMTGDLSDNHEIISLKFYDMDGAVGAKYNSNEYAGRTPSVKDSKPQRTHVYGPPVSSKAWRLFKRFMFVVVVFGLSGCSVIGVMLYLSKRQKDRMKRFY